MVNATAKTVGFTALIPARLASTRLPNKPLADIAGIPMVIRVAHQAQQSGAIRVVVATDSPEVMTACKRFDIEAVLTRQDHVSGSDRLAEACTLLGLAADSIVVNVQGDEPLIDPALIAEVAAILASRPDCAISTAAHAIETLTEFENPNVVKVVLDREQTALYFSRAPVPMARDGALRAWWTPESTLPKPLRHVGIYGYRVSFLARFPTLASAPMELVESLEQLRALWHGYKIAVCLTDTAPAAGVDTLEDLERVRQLVTASAGRTFG